MTAPRSDALAAAFLAARGDPSLAVLEGFHAVKHALRFGAELRQLCTCDAEQLRRLTHDLAPDLATRLPTMATVVSKAEFRRFAPAAHETGVIAIARRPAPPASIAEVPRTAPLVLLDDPSHLGNVGAAVRVAAAAGAAGVVTHRGPDPWHPTAIRGSAGLHFALSVWRTEVLERPDRGIIALDPAGEPLDGCAVPDDAILAFGSERAGLSQEIRSLASRRIRIPMREGVSSLNLATAVAVVMYRWRLDVRRETSDVRRET